MSELHEVSIGTKEKPEKNLDYYKWLKMRKGWIVFILVGYFLSLIATIGQVIYMYPFRHSSNFNLLIFGVSFSVLSCLLYYIRKMYKHLIRGEMTLINSKEDMTVEELGTLAYFMFRPPMAIVFGILTFFILEVFFRLTISSGDGYSVGYIMLVAIIEFLGGFSVGRFIENLDQVAKRVVDNLFRKVGE